MMRNLFRVLLVSSALVAVSAPSAFATPQQEATAAINGDFAALPGLLTDVSFDGISAATALCNGNKACVVALLTAYAQAGFSPSATQLNTIAQTAGVTFSTAEVQQFAIGAVGTPATPGTFSGIGSGVAAGGGGGGGLSTGPSTSPQ